MKCVIIIMFLDYSIFVLTEKLTKKEMLSIQNYSANKTDTIGKN